MQETMVQEINDAFSEFSTPIVGTDCTEWKGSVTGAGTPQVFFKNVEDESGEKIMARTVAQCVHYLQTGEDLNNTNYVLVRTCSTPGCTNPAHYEKTFRSKTETVGKPITKNKKPERKSKITIIPRWQLREKGFNEIKSTYFSLSNVSILSEKYNIPRALVRKIMESKAELEAS